MSANAMVSKNIRLSQPLCLAVDRQLHSDFLGKVPYGAWSALVTKLLEGWLDSVTVQPLRGLD